MGNESVKSAAAKILLVDDDTAVRGALRNTLQDAGYQIVDVANGKAAQQAYVLEPFDLVLSDIRMPMVNGIELLHYVKRVKPIPVILMTGFSELCETQEAFTLGADGFLAKPFSKSELLDLISKCRGVMPKTKGEAAPANFCKINIDDFVSGRQIHSDVFIKISDDRYIKIAHRGEDLPLEKIREYKKKSLKFLYIRAEDYAGYIGLNLALVRAAAQNSQIPADKKMNLLKHAGEIVSGHLQFEGLDEESYEYGKTFIENAINLLTSQEDGFKLLTALESHTDFLYAHSVAVSMISVLLARQLKWQSIINIFKIAMGGLLHDIGMKDLEQELVTKNRESLSAEEAKMYSTHSMRGLESLKQLQSVPSDVIHIVLEHHEDCGGRGYPSGMKKSQIHPLARLVAVADEFCYLSMKSPASPGLPPKEAVQKLVNMYWERLDRDFIQALAAVFNVEIAPQGRR